MIIVNAWLFLDNIILFNHGVVLLRSFDRQGTTEVGDTVGQSVYRCWCLAPRPTELLRKRKSVQSKCFFQTWGLSLPSCGVKRKSSEASLTTKDVRNLTDLYNEWTMCCSVMGL